MNTEKPSVAQNADSPMKLFLFFLAICAVAFLGYAILSAAADIRAAVAANATRDTTPRTGRYVVTGSGGGLLDTQTGEVWGPDTSNQGHWKLGYQKPQ